MANPVVAIPGYFGSKLADAARKNLIWIDGHGLLSPEVTLEALRLDIGDPNRVIPVGILDEVVILPPFWDPGFYNGLTTFLRGNLNLVTFEFFYDWRKSLEEAADLLHNQILRWSNETGASLFDLVAHSFGGLVARAYLEKHGPDRVGRLITLGTPHTGTLETFTAIVQGSKVFTFPAAKVKQVSRTFPSAYELLPSDPTNGLFSIDGQGASAFQSDAWCATQPMKDFLAIAKARVTSLLPQTLPVDSFFIYGTRTDTTSSAAFTNGKMTFDEQDQGDGTVPQASASGGGLLAAQGKSLRRFAIPFAPHAHLFGMEKVQQRVLTPVLLRRDLPDLQLFSGFRQEPLFVPRTSNFFAAAVFDAGGTLITNAEVKLTITGTTVRDQVIPVTNRGDYATKVIMPGPGDGRRYTVTARVPGAAQLLADQGLLVPTES
ncbi:MAG TPA: alpha/beta fold hydrolase [Thermoanaerobaculia bacterium]|nr:alpha/beta fold hydrolase [Thermoanaerobaculia bacterium]